MVRALRMICIAALLGLTLVPACGGGGSRGNEPGTDAVASQELSSVNAAIQANNVSWTAGENSITGLSTADRALLNGISGTGASRLPAARGRAQSERSAAQLASSLDWRSDNGSYWVSTPGSQGVCGSSAAFAVLSAFEAVSRVANNNALQSADYSEADLFACGGGSCSEGWTLTAAATRLQTAGVVDEECLAYSASDSVCSSRCSDWQTRLNKVDSWSWVTSGDATAIKTALQNGPVAAIINVYTDFYYYKSGTYKHVYGDLQGRHAVVIAGYNDTGGYWIIQNSWGMDWGETGFANVAYGQIGIEDYVMALSVSGNPATVSAVAGETSLALAGGSASLDVSCVTSGAVSKLDVRCDDDLGWEALASGSTTKTCTYTSAGTYTPGCRVNQAIIDNADSPITVTQYTPPGSNLTVTAGVTPASGNTSTSFTVTCTISGTATPSSLKYRCDTLDDWTAISSGTSANCTYSFAGSYTPACLVDNSAGDPVDTAVTVKSWMIDTTVSANPIGIGDTVDITCDTGDPAQYALPESLEYRCDSIGTWASITSGRTATCPAYGTAGPDDPAGRGNGTRVELLGDDTGAPALEVQ